MKFESKFGTNELVEFKPKGDKSEENVFGFVREVTFFRADAVNHAAYYKIECANTKEMLSIPEHDVIKRYMVS